jgi:hypothetical protein
VTANELAQYGDLRLRDLVGRDLDRADMRSMMHDYTVLLRSGRKMYTRGISIAAIRDRYTRFYTHDPVVSVTRS